MNNSTDYFDIFHKIASQELGHAAAMKSLKELWLKKNSNDLLYAAYHWQEVSYPQYKEAAQETTLLLFYPDTAQENNRQFLQDHPGLKVYNVNRGSHYRKIDDYNHIINTGNKEELEKYLLPFKNKSGIKIIYFLKDYHEISENNPNQITEEEILPLFLMLHILVNLKSEYRIDVLFVYPAASNYQQAFYQGLSGLARTLDKESKKVFCKIIEADSIKSQFAQIIYEALYFVPGEFEVKLEIEKKYIKRIIEIDIASQVTGNVSFKTNGVYIITGGAGGLGLIFSEYLVNNYKAKLILTGRSPDAITKNTTIRKLIAAGNELIYIPADISIMAEAKKMVSGAKQKFKQIDGIIHAAGVIKDAYLHKKSIEEIRNVINPKAAGTINLDILLKDENLDFFVLFSSLSAAGNPGQADYAYANSFLNDFSAMRNRLVNEKKRSGKTVSICWPYWTEGGMHIDLQTIQLIENTTGVRPLETMAGIDALQCALKSNQDHLLVFPGNKKNIRERSINPGKTVKEHPGKPETVSKAETGKMLKEFLQSRIADILKIEKNDIDIKVDMSEYGFDSVSFTSFANIINNRYHINLTPAIFFEYPTIASFMDFLSTEYKEKIEWLPVPDTANGISMENDQETPEMDIDNDDASLNHFRITMGNTENTDSIANQNEPVAIIGMAGIFPGADTLDEFWHNLETGKDCISEIPPDRWNWKEYWGDPSSEDNKTNIKWGGFINDIDKFDAAFFNISPREAIVMDPQHRLIFETVWNTIENAGYNTAELSGTATGLFIGVQNMEYLSLIQENNIPIEAHISTGNSHALLANRISYFFNLTGPSEASDTACASSLIGVHRAIQAIKNGDCSQAIIGAVNSLLSPYGYISLNKAGALSPCGRCKTFDKNADGYARAEGAGAILIKPLKNAIDNKDHIYAVIIGSAENHGGRAKSLTAPNPNAQAALIIKAMERAHVDPSTITYIEAHGTGTNLGDPIEINGLKKAYKELYAKWHLKDYGANQYCGISSVKTNIGHLETGAGMAGIIKILLSLEHKKLPGTVHFKALNPYIKLEDSPFYIIKETKEWEALTDSKGDPIPRRAGISSFGFGGSNAHVILEEYTPQNNHQETKIDNLNLYLFSARNEERLKEYIKSFTQFLATTPAKNIDLDNIAFTLQTGREHREERLAVITGNLKDLTTYLQGYRDNRNSENIFSGNINNKNVSNLLLDGKEGAEYLKMIISEKKWTKLAQLWISGINIDWPVFWKKEKVNRVALPAYIFEKKRYWIESKLSNTGYKNIHQPNQTVDEYITGTISDNPLINENNITHIIKEKLEKILSLKTEDIPDNKNLQDMGLDSVMTVQFIKLLNDKWNLKLRPSLINDKSTIDKLSAHISTIIKDNDNSEEEGVI